MWIEIFRSGTHTDSSGATESYSEELLDKIAGLYNEKTSESASFEAPVVKGHPKTDAPAYGWVERLARRGSSLMAKLKELQPEFINEVKKGMFKKVSMAIYPDLTLRHVGFLGAAAPAVKGLKPVSFSGGDDYKMFEKQLNLSKEMKSFDNNHSEYSFDYELQNDNEALSTIDNIIESESTNEQEQTQPAELATENFSENYQQKICNLEAELQALGTKNSELEAEKSRLTEIIAEKEKSARRKEFREFADSLLENPEGTPITPAQAEELIELLEAAHSIDSIRRDSLEYSENDSAVHKIKHFILTLKPGFTTREFATGKGIPTLTSSMDLSNKNISPARLQLHEKARELQVTTPGLTYEEAVCIARKDYFL